MRRLFQTKGNREHYRELLLEKYERHEDADLGMVWGTRDRISNYNGKSIMVYDLILFLGSSSKPYINSWYTSAENREAGIRSCLDGRRRHRAFKDEQKAARKAESLAPNPAKVGDILVSSWGYDQTNVDWYQVVEVKGKNTIVIRRIAANSECTGWERGDCSPVKDAFLDNYEPKTCRVKKSKDGYSVRVRDFAWAYYEPKGEEASHFWTSYA